MCLRRARAHRSRYGDLHWQRDESPASSIPDDGLFDVTLVGPLNKISLALRIRDFIEGKVYSFKEAHHGRGKTVEVLPNSKNTTFLKQTGNLWALRPLYSGSCPIPEADRWKDFVPFRQKRNRT